MTIESVWDAHLQAEFADKDPDAAVAVMTEDATLIHVPVATGARGRDALRTFYADHFIPAWPDDTAVTTTTRTIGDDRLVDEMLVSWTHDRVMDFMLPGVAPTGRAVELPFMGIAGFRDGLLAYEHIYWDQASLLVQLGLLDPTTAPMLDVEQARALVDENVPLNRLITDATRPHEESS